MNFIMIWNKKVFNWLCTSILWWVKFFENKMIINLYFIFWIYLFLHHFSSPTSKSKVIVKKWSLILNSLMLFILNSLVRVFHKLREVGAYMNWIEFKAFTIEKSDIGDTGCEKTLVMSFVWMNPKTLRKVSTKTSPLQTQILTSAGNMQTSLIIWKIRLFNILIIIFLHFPSFSPSFTFTKKKKKKKLHIHTHFHPPSLSFSYYNISHSLSSFFSLYLRFSDFFNAHTQPTKYFRWM